MPIFGIMTSILMLSMKVNAQEVNIHELMQRKDLNLQQIDEIAKKHFKKVGTGQGSGNKQYERWKYEQKFHLREDGTFTTPQDEATAYQFAVRSLKTTNSAERAAPWTELGPKSWTATSGWNPGVGRLTSVAIHPSNESIIYVSSPGGGIWKSTDAAVTWNPLIDNVNSSWMNVFNLCIDPSNANTIYAGLSSGAVLKSTNAGTTWAATGSGPSSIKKILVHPTNSNIVFAAANNGVYRSVNGGTNWTSVQAGSFQDIEFKADDANIMFASTSNSSYYRSTNNGVNWTLIPLAASGRTLLAVSPNNPNVVYAVQASGSLFGRFYKSTDAGLTFNTLITGSSAAGTNFFGYSTAGTDDKGQATYDMGMCVNPTNADEVHIAGIICWKSTNGGTSFVAETAWSYPNAIGYNHADMHGLEWVNNTIYSVSDGGIYKSTNNGGDWTDLSSGLGIRQLYRIACAKTDAERICAGAQDNGTVMRQTNGTWKDWLGADGMDCVFSPTNANIAIGTSQYGSIYKTTNGGTSRTSLAHPVDANWVTPIFMHPTNHDTVYGGWDGIYRSVNGGTNWTKLTTGVTTGNMDCLAVGSSNTRYIYGSAGSTLYRSSNAGATWTSVAIGATVSSICVSPLNPQKIWITTTSSSNNVRVSLDMGTTFTVISAGLPSLAARSVVVDNDASEGLYVGMNLGVYYKDNVNTAWVVLATGMPLVAINEVELQISSRKIRVGTYGRGIWETGMQAVPASVNAGPDVAVNCTSPNATLTAIGGVSYVWSNGATTAAITVSPTVTTTYTVTATMSGGGTAIDAVVVTANKTAPTASITASNGLNLNCTTTSTTLTAAGGTSYAWSNGSNTATTIVTTAATFTVTVTAANGCNATASVNTTLTPSTSNTTTISVCDTYTWAENGQTYTSSGTFTKVTGCHTEVLVLTITPSTSNTTTISVCDTYTWATNGQTYTSSGTFTKVTGCHTEILALTIMPSTSNTTTISACDTYTWAADGQTYTSNGTFTKVTGCHTENLVLTITPSTSDTTTITTCDTYIWAVDGQTYTRSGTYTFVNACHTEILELNITPSTSNTTTISACDAYTWAENGQTYTSSGTFTKVTDCHTEILVLTITPSTSNTTTASACSYYTWAEDGQTYTASGTYTFVNACHTATLLLTISDTQVPVLTGIPANVTVSCDQIPSAANVAATDNCGVPTITMAESSTKGTDPALCSFYTYTITRTWTAVDAANNTATAIQVLTVRDVTAPTLSAAPANVTVGTPLPVVATLTATDNCQTSPVVITYAQTTVNNTIPACYTVYKTYTRRWTATDICGNKNTTTQVIVSATQATIACPTNKSLNTNSDVLANNDCATTMLSTSSVIPTVTNPCNVPLNYTITGATVATGTGNIVGLSMAKGVSRVTYAAGGASCSFTITVADTEKPKIAATQVVFDNTCVFPSTIPSIYDPIASDNCTTVAVTIVSDVTANVSGCSTKAADLKFYRLLTRTYKATDASNNTATTAQKIYLRDKVAPTANCKDITVSIGTVNVLVAANLLDNGSFDNCSGVTFGICSGATCTSFGTTLTLKPSQIVAPAISVVLPVKLRVTDACGNISICTANITLKKVGTLTNSNSGGATTAQLNETSDANLNEAVIPSGIDASANSLQCFPNPFNSELNLNYNLNADATDVKLKIYDAVGKLVTSSEQGASLAGYYQMRWNLAELSNGLYHICLEIDGKCQKTQRVMMIK